MNYTDTDLYLLYRINQEIKNDDFIIKNKLLTTKDMTSTVKEEFLKILIERMYRIIFDTIQSETKTINQEKGYKAGLEEGYKNGYKDGYSKACDDYINDDCALY